MDVSAGAGRHVRPPLDHLRLHRVLLLDAALDESGEMPLAPPRHPSIHPFIYAFSLDSDISQLVYGAAVLLDCYAVAIAATVSYSFMG